jgi:hypothetical protein
MQLTCRNVGCREVLRRDVFSPGKDGEPLMEHDDRGDFIMCPKCGAPYFLLKTVAERSLPGVKARAPRSA